MVNANTSTAYNTNSSSATWSSTEDVRTVVMYNENGRWKRRSHYEQVSIHGIPVFVSHSLDRTKNLTIEEREKRAFKKRLKLLGLNLNHKPLKRYKKTKNGRESR